MGWGLDGEGGWDGDLMGNEMVKELTSIKKWSGEEAHGGIRNVHALEWNAEKGVWDIARELTSNNHMPTSLEHQLTHAENTGVDTVVEHLGIGDGEGTIGRSNCRWIKCGNGHASNSPTDAAAR